eukprot:TRINITY_DN29162_c0_g1_i1.p1 TRINITY_DN29162_c0_g1~~TRINITY_DN29162_c0_g1_i1.p1  ORF type:complete len:1252 (-),score=359.39 TRINITY_DN29162_c0_g1_i1:241-3996(-)
MTLSSGMAPLVGAPPLAVDAAKRQLSAVLQLGRQEMQRGGYMRAVEHFSVALELRPGLVHAMVCRGYSYLLMGDEGRAQQDFHAVIAKDSGFNRNVYVLMALCLKRSGDYHTAIRYLSRCIAQFPNFRPALLARGELCIKVREYDKARLDFRQVSLDSPSHLVARRGLGDALRGLGDLREAAKQYSKAIEMAYNALDEAEAAEGRGPHGYSDGGSPGGGHPGVGYDSDLQMARSCSENATASETTPGGMYEDVYPEYHSQADEMLEDEMPSTIDLENSAHDMDATAKKKGHPADALVSLQDEPLRSQAQLQAFLMEVLMRRALLLRIAGDLEGAGADFLEVLQAEPQNGLALFWYAKLLIEQHRHKEAPAFLQASIQHHEETRAPALALLGALLVTRAEPDCAAAARHLRKAVQLAPNLQAVRITQWICGAASALRDEGDCGKALALLDKALLALGCNNAASISSKGGTAAPRLNAGSLTARGIHVAGSGGAAAAVAAAAGLAKGQSPEETCWKTARSVVRRRQVLAQGDDLQLALDCSSYLQLVARTPQQQAAHTPPLLHTLRAIALCRLGHWEEAVAECRQTLAIDPDDEASKYNMNLASGVLWSRAQEYERAVGLFTKAVRLRPVSAEARVHRAIALAAAARAYSVTASGEGAAGSRALQLLTDAVQDLEAAEQQAEITEATVPPGTEQLKAACLCGLGRVAEAWETLQQAQEKAARAAAAAAGLHSPPLLHSPPTPQANVEPSKRWKGATLEAEVLVLMGRHNEAIEACTALLLAAAGEGADRTMAHLMRARCYADLGQAEKAFEDCREALILAPERADIHEASGMTFLAHSCYSEAITALNTAAKLQGSLSPRLAYLRGVAQLAIGNAAAALKDFARALRLVPNTPVASRARDGVSAIQMLLDGDVRTAYVRLNVLLHSRQPGAHPSAAGDLGGGGGSMPGVFASHELLLYRGVCSMYSGEPLAASQDFENALQIAQQMHMAAVSAAYFQSEGGQDSSQGGLSADGPSARSSAGKMALARQAPEIASQMGLLCFECEILYNVVLCHLLAKDYRAANGMCEKLLQHTQPLAALGPRAQCLAWFLLGICRLSLGDARSEAVREAFMHSFAYDPIYVDDFLRRHEPHGDADYPVRNVTAGLPQRRVGAPPPVARNGNANPVRPAPPCEACDAAPEAVACLRWDKGALGAQLPPRRIQVRDVVIWCRASAAWPYVQPPALSPALPVRFDGSRPDLPHHEDVGVTPAFPWD